MKHWLTALALSRRVNPLVPYKPFALIARRLKPMAPVMAIALLTACANEITTTPPTNVHQPMSVRPTVIPTNITNPGSIYQPGQMRLALFEDRRARNVGDTLMVRINEKNTASTINGTKTNRAQAMSNSVSLPTGFGVDKSGLGSLGLGLSSGDKFDGSGESSSKNEFTSMMTATVVEVLPNGYLIVSGEKQMSLNQGSEVLRFSGVVNPDTIRSDNTVSSTQVADARLEYKGSGALDQAQRRGWFTRFWQAISPF